MPALHSFPRVTLIIMDFTYALIPCHEKYPAAACALRAVCHIFRYIVCSQDRCLLDRNFIMPLRQASEIDAKKKKSRESLRIYGNV